jgi:uncharacterized phage-associated protein
MKYDYKNSIKNRKVIETIFYLLNKSNDGLDQYRILKLSFLADKAHLINYARTITRDSYIAIKYGPVGSRVRDILNSNSYLPAEDTKFFESYIIKTKIKNIINYRLKKPITECKLKTLSISDKRVLDAIFARYSDYSFEQLKVLTHRLPEWKKHEKELFDSKKSKDIPVLDLLEEDPVFDTPKERLNLAKEVILS